MKRTNLFFSIALICTIFISAASFSADGAINESLLNKIESNFKADAKAKFAMNAIANNTINNLSLNREKVIAHNDLFTHKLTSSDVINQASSGRCWIFAGVNVFSPKIMNKLQLSDFEISESYLAFYDKLEKANYFLEKIIELRDKPLDDRSLQSELQSMFGDGGWWNYFLSLMEKYGVVPISAMPETNQSKSTGQLNSLGKTLLRKFASELRQMHQNGKSEKDLRKRKEEMLNDIYHLLAYNYGMPPKEFKFRYEFKDKDDTTKTEKQIIEETYAPKQFYQKYIGDDLPEYVAIVNNPVKEYNTLYRLNGARNIQELPDMEVLNMPIETLKKYTLASLYDSQAVWFACDVGKENYRDSAIMDLDIYDYNLTFGLDFKMTKKERIQYGDISPNHAMAITGIDTAADGSTTKWLIENSWGTKNGDDGFWYMYDDWFNEYVLLVIVEKRLLSDEDKKLFEQKPVIIKDWEPFFLALKNLR